MNPVLSREILERFRTRRAALMIFLWTLGIALVGYVVYLLGQQMASGFFGIGRLVASGFVGRFMFQGMTLLMVTGVVMVVPGITALAIVGERERQTFPLLQVTQLGPLQLIVGKLTSSLSYFLLLLVAVAPIMALPLLFGGTSLADVAAALGMIIVTALMIGSVSILVSARARSSRGAVAGAYAFSFLIAFFSIAMILAELLLVRGPAGEIVPPRGREVYSSWINPYVGTVDAVLSPLAFRTDGQFTPFSPAELLLFARQGISASMWGGGNMAVDVPAARGGGVAMGFNDAAMIAPPPVINQGQQPVRLRRGPVWIRTLILYVVIGALALIRAAGIVRAPALRTIRTKRVRNAS
jgi:ABC-type transport system involved in multi-copper enzyme maturation permease subunit